MEVLRFRALSGKNRVTTRKASSGPRTRGRRALTEHSCDLHIAPAHLPCAVLLAPGQVCCGASPRDFIFSYTQLANLSCFVRCNFSSGCSSCGFTRPSSDAFQADLCQAAPETTEQLFAEIMKREHVVCQDASHLRKSRLLKPQMNSNVGKDVFFR